MRSFILLSLLSLFPVTVFGTCDFTRLAPREPRPANPAFRREHFTAEGVGRLTTEVLDDKTIHFSWSAKTAATPDGEAMWTSPMVTDEPMHGPTQYARNGNTIETAQYRLDVDPATLALSVTEKATGRHYTALRPADLHQDWKGIDIAPGDFGHVYGLGQYHIDGGTDGTWAGRDWVGGPDGNTVRGFYDGRPSNSQFPIMYAVGRDGASYALFLDVPHKINWDFRDGGRWQSRMWGDDVRGYLMLGKNLPELRERFMGLTGRPPVPPKEVFGFGVSQFGYKSADEVRRDLDRLAAAGVKVDWVGLDLQWFGGGFGGGPDGPYRSQMGTLRADRANFPHFRDFVKELGARGVGLMPIQESYVDRHLPESRWFAKRGLFVKNAEGEPSLIWQNPWWGKGYLLDWSNPATRKNWFDLKVRPLVRAGVLSHWLDLGEPEMYNPDGRFDGGGMYPRDDQNKHPDFHNLYSLLWAKGIHEGVERNNLDRRVFMLSRAGTVGMQKYGAGLWGGDTGATHEALISHLRMHIMNMGLVGIDYHSSDVGGFFRYANDGDPGKQYEIYTQWLANSLLLDVPVRPHTWNLANDRKFLPHEIGHADSNVSNINLRQELAPYYYALGHLAHEKGEPIISPLVYYHQHDANVRDMGHEAMIGRSLLMGVVAARYEQARNVYLPAGRWFDYHTGDTHDGGQWLYNMPVWRQTPGEKTAVLKLPLYAKAGAVIPLGGNGGFRVRVYPDATETFFHAVEDDGRSNGYLRGEIRRTEVRQRLVGNVAEVTVKAASGTYPGAVERRAVTVEVHGDSAPRGVTVNGQPAEWSYDGARKLVVVPRGDVGVDDELAVRVEW